MKGKCAFAVFFAVTLLAFSGCSDYFAEKQLIGTWLYTDSSDGGYSETITRTWTLVCGTDNVLEERVVETSSLSGEIGVVEGVGEYRVEGNELYTHSEVTLNTLNRWTAMTATRPYSISGDCMTILDGGEGGTEMKYYRQ
jgi:hypothetical protein